MSPEQIEFAASPVAAAPLDIRFQPWSQEMMISSYLVHVRIIKDENPWADDGMYILN